VRTHRMKVVVPRDHQLEVHLPADFPPGPAEIVVQSTSEDQAVRESQESPGLPSPASQQMLAVLEELRSVPLTPEDERILDDFESFRRQHPFRLGSLEETS